MQTTYNHNRLSVALKYEECPRHISDISHGQMTQPDRLLCSRQEGPSTDDTPLSARD